jgi:hypothetical protein
MTTEKKGPLSSTPPLRKLPHAWPRAGNAPWPFRFRNTQRFKERIWSFQIFIATSGQNLKGLHIFNNYIAYNKNI